jgi:hypothetical protein
MARSLLAICCSMVATTLSTGVPSAATFSSALRPSSNTTAAAVSLNAASQRPAVAVAPSQSAEHAAVVNTNAAPGAEASTAPLRIPLPQALLIAPRGCAALERTFDVLIHFHGAYTTTEPQLMKSGINAVYVVKNLGNFSGPYESAFASPGSFKAEIAAIRARINRSCGGPERSVGRIALSGWSAGYGAIYKILARPDDAARVDAVVLADGMHVGYEPGSHRVRSAAMTPFIDFAKAAAQGEKLMAVTHSAIVPPSYASTTETARFIRDQLNLTPAAEGSEEPRAGMHRTSNDARGDLHVTGYAGGDAHAHCDHLYAISTTLWSRLRDRWQRRP